MNLERAMNFMLHIILKKFNIEKINGSYNLTFIWGHWSRHGKISTKLLRDHWSLKHGIQSFIVDESWSSQIHYKFKEDENGKINQFCQPVELKKTIGQKTPDKLKLKWTINKNDKKDLGKRPLKTIRVWHLLTCNCNHTDCNKFIHRDKNGCLNILKIAMDILSFNFRFFPRYVSEVLVDSESTSASL